MAVAIRDFEVEDYEEVVRVSNAAYVDYPETAEEWRYSDEHRDPKLRWRRFVAEDDGRVVGVASFANQSWTFHPRKFWVDVTVHPACRQRGIGGALYDHVRSCLASYDPILLWSGTREDYAHSVEFLARRGFRELMREWESRLSVTEFDFGPYAGAIERVEATGIRIATLRELETDAGRDRRLYDLHDMVARDVPASDEYTSGDFDVFVDRLNSNPDVLPDGYFVAVDGDRYVGLSNLYRAQAQPDAWYQGLTGTLPEYRRRGIALALKLKTIAHARANDIRVIKTWNASTNSGMLSINDRLGFVRQPAWIEFGLEV